MEIEEGAESEGGEPWRLRTHVRIPVAATSAAKAAAAASTFPGVGGLEIAANVTDTLQAMKQDIELISVEMVMILMLLGLTILLLLWLVKRTRLHSATFAPGKTSSSIGAYTVVKAGKNKGAAYAKVVSEHPDYIARLGQRYDNIGSELQGLFERALGLRLLR